MSESTGTNSSGDCTVMTSVGGSDPTDSSSSTAVHDKSGSCDELLVEAGSLCTHGGDEREVSPQIPDLFKGINIDGVKLTNVAKTKPPVLNLDMNDSVAGLQDPPPSPEADPQKEEDSTSGSARFEGHSLPADYSSYEGSSYEDREFDFLRAEPVKRSTSLKTNKTPPGTPSRKKGVRFADALGLDLESVRHILNLEAPPKIPATALKDLKVMPDTEDQKRFVVGSRYLTACFAQPGAATNFPQRVADQKVVLENCLVDDTDMLVTGSIRVANVSYHKKVIVRYSVNNWLTFDDLTASYVANSNDGPTDRFSFTINIPQYFGVGSKLQFCIMYTTAGNTFWDSNYGNNYSIECYDRVVPLQEHHDHTWLHFL